MANCKFLKSFNSEKVSADTEGLLCVDKLSAKKMDPAKEDMPNSIEVTNLENKPQEVGAKSGPLDVLKKWKIAWQDKFRS